MLLSLENVTKSYPAEDGPVQILRGVSLSLGAGETLALTGESGCGKSTLLHLVGGLDRPDGGSITLDGQAVHSLGDRRLAALRRSTVSVVFQQFNLIPSLTVADNISFQARLAGRFDAEHVASLAEAMGLAPHGHKYPEQLSGGQQQRVAIARALAARPKLILADEPTGNLDEMTANVVMDLMLAQVQAGKTALLMVTHSERLAARLSRQLRLSEGRVA